MRGLFSYAVMTLLWCGCSGDDAPSLVSVAPDASAESSSASHACIWPAPAASCTPGKNFLVCVVPNGDRVEADGTVSDANGKPVPSACKHPCKSTDYALTCTGNDAASPALIASLGCTFAPAAISTPPGVTLWCCPCSH
jgi:hypothetical protein